MSPGLLTYPVGDPFSPMSIDLVVLGSGDGSSQLSDLRVGSSPHAALASHVFHSSVSINSHINNNPEGYPVDSNSESPPSHLVELPINDSSSAVGSTASDVAICFLCQSVCCFCRDRFEWDSMSCKILFNDFNLEISADASTCPGYRITETLLNFAPSGMCIDLSSPDSKFSFDHLEFDMHSNKIDINPELYEFADKNMDHISQACQRGFNFMSRLCVCDYSHDCGLLFACPLKAHTQAFFNANDSYNFNDSEISNMFIFFDGGFFEGHIRHSTWAASIVLEDSQQVFKAAKSFGGQLSFDPNNPMFCGAVLPSNSFVSEVYAQVMARLI